MFHINLKLKMTFCTFLNVENTLGYLSQLSVQEPKTIQSLYITIFGLYKNISGFTSIFFFSELKLSHFH